ncbi:YbaB/EbfC family nucleoid-associated protein [Chitinophaga silvisoli]|uniref:Nucleoid-associated protein DXN04_09680 n=1 Tax=Chitinophaga silvisoli TaxID=2291814 RepID=A0A3E1P620_9BACT|nr:YbaB/EbfC family nucleoid-associated protein [Chitinophaga silvisoli]RFM35635.1 YbaB/EbfC family nucleoid-associated protein [Chitinophaga silvisoli]
MFDMFGKLQEAQQKMKESKERLALITVDGEAGDGAVKVTVTGNREVKSLEIAERLLEKDNKEELEDLVITALNRALKSAENTWEAEMKSVAGGMLGPLGGLF